MDILARILKTTEEKGYQQQDIAKHLGIHKNNVTDWKSGRTRSYERYLPQIADFLGVSVDYLLGKETKPAETSEGLSPMEQIIIDAYRSASPDGQAKMIQAVMNIADKK